MGESLVSPNIEKAKTLLNKLWMYVNTEETGHINSEIDQLIKSKYVSIRYCLPTQLLGKLVDNKLDCLCLQKGDGGEESLWDPRSFAAKVIVPWVAENQNVLGTSTDPYVSKPLRKRRLEPEPGNVKGEHEWKLLFRVLHDVAKRNDNEYTRTVMILALRSIYQILRTTAYEYYIPERISIEQTLHIVTSFLSEASGGDRGLSVAAALFQTIGLCFGLYKDIKRHVINASDQATGLAGDIECIDFEGNTKLVVEVKERMITLTDVRSTIQKARKVSIKELILNAPGINSTEEQQVQELISSAWASGTNIYQLSIDEMLKVCLALMGEKGRRDFINNIGTQLNLYNTQPSNRKRWKELLEEI